jgi:phosphoglycolate phosphatase
MMSRQLVIFDFDGTLADSFNLFVEAFDVTAGLYGFLPFDRANVSYLRTLDAKHILNYHGVPSWKLPFIVRAIRRHMGKSMNGVKLFSGIGSILTQLRHRGFVLALLTSNSYDNVKQVLEAERLAYFQYVECGTSVFGKAQKLKKLAKLSGFDKNSIVFVGDEIRDSDAARAAHIRFMGVGWGYTEASALSIAGGYECFQKPADLAHLLQREP